MPGTWLVQVRARDAEGDTSVWSPLRWVTIVVDDAPSPSATVPYTFGLQETYPNPFNAQTTIHYSLATAGTMSLQLFDVTGRLVTTLASGRQTAGTHELRWNGSNHASGVYWLRLTSGSQTATRKVALVK
ncbi:MAG: T9SS type A sorting domain-containing protein [bacterium]|nr:T9SS type A sorting domain-containing protein [bacterium]